MAPSNEYLLFDAHPAIKIAATTKLEIASIKNNPRSMFDPINIPEKGIAANAA